MQAKHSIQDFINIVHYGISKYFDDPFAGSAFALFDPGQQTLLHDEIIKPKVAFILRANTRLCFMPGFKAHSNQVCALQSPSINPLK